MPTTTNFGWTTPADTDLVKDGASAIRTLGNGVDSSMAQLKGGTTGQILSKTSNSDMAFTWINNDQGDITAVTAGTGISGGGTSGAVTITNSMATEITAAGDIIVGTGSGTFDNLPIGTTGQILTADTTVSPYKVKWASATAAGTSWTLLNSGGTALTAASTITVSGISAKNKIYIHIDLASSVNNNVSMYLRLNADTAANYYMAGMRFRGPSTYDASVTQGYRNQADNFFVLGTTQNTDAYAYLNGDMFIDAGNSSGIKTVQYTGGGVNIGYNSQEGLAYGGYWNNSSTISSVSIISGTGNFDNGTIYVYTSN